MIQAIETRYKDYRFRSRLEARWAVFFDALEVKWEYEKEGFAFDDGSAYLPDFWLPDVKIWLEIKGEQPTEEERRKLVNLHTGTGQSAMFVVGSIGEHIIQIEPVPAGGYTWDGEYVPIARSPTSAYLNLFGDGQDEDGCGIKLACPVCGSNQVRFRSHSKILPSIDKALFTADCANDHKILLSVGNTDGQARINIIATYERLNNPFWFLSMGDETRYQAAIAAARSARFEHGERG